jgi:hypothetical protein
MSLWERECAVSLGMKAFWGGIVLLMFLPGAVFPLLSGRILVVGIVGAPALAMLIFALAITPKSIICEEDRLAVKLWLGINFKVPVGNIKEVRKLLPRDVFSCIGLPLRSAWTTPVLITRKKGCQIMLTPGDPNELIERLTAMMESPRSSV